MGGLALPVGDLVTALHHDENLRIRLADQQVGAHPAGNRGTAVRLPVGILAALGKQARGEQLRRDIGHDPDLCSVFVRHDSRLGNKRAPRQPNLPYKCRKPPPPQRRRRAGAGLQCRPGAANWRGETDLRSCCKGAKRAPSPATMLLHQSVPLFRSSGLSRGSSAPA